MVPSARLVWVLALPTLAALALLAAPRLLLPLLCFDALFVAVAVIDALLSWRGLVTVARECPTVLAVDRPTRVRVELRSRTRRELTVDLYDDGFEGASIEGCPRAPRWVRTEL